MLAYFWTGELNLRTLMLVSQILLQWLWVPVSICCKKKKKLGTWWLELCTDLPKQTSRFLPEIYYCRSNQMLAMLNRKNRSIFFLMGDFNISIFHQNTNTSDFINMLDSHFLLPVFSTTRNGLVNSSCTDNIYTNHPLHQSIRKIILDFSYHLPIFLPLNLCSAIELRNKTF